MPSKSESSPSKVWTCGGAEKEPDGLDMIMAGEVGQKNPGPTQGGGRRNGGQLKECE